MIRALVLLHPMSCLAACLALAACSPHSTVLPGADRDNGRLLLRQFGCGTCHRIPGVAAATGTAGPPLDGIARRVYLGGVLPNSPDNMVRWIRNPQSIEPDTAMPRLGVTESQARDMVSYLMELR